MTVNANNVFVGSPDQTTTGAILSGPIIDDVPETIDDIVVSGMTDSGYVNEDGVTTVFPAGFVHLPKIDAEFIQQLCAEQLITRRDRNGFPIREWQKIRERNEALDCYVYARAAACAAGLDRFEERHWRELERQLGMERPPDEPPPIQAFDPDEATQRGGLSVSATPSRRRVIKSRWLSS